MLTIIIVVIAIALVIWWWTVEGYASSYTEGGYYRLGDAYGGTPLFSPCLAKRCAGGPYMYTNNPYLQALCQGTTNAKLAQCACGKGFKGKPIKFDYSNLSNGAWTNALCNTPDATSLCVL